MTKKFIFSLLLLATSFLSLSAQPKREVRAVWLTTIGGLDWPHNYARQGLAIEKQQQELRTILDKLQKAGVNTVLLQARIRGTVIYPSDKEPWDGCLSGLPGTAPGYDALGFAIEECHKRGMELHAWVVTIPVGKWNGLGCKRLRQRFPHLIVKIGEDGYMNPEKPQTADYLAEICREITERYDIDGIHLDYIRYPETWKIKVSPDQGRANITSIVAKIHDAVKPVKPWIKMSCSPIGKADDLTRYWSHGWNARKTVLQDAQQWLKDGLMDALFPMMYFKDNNFYPFAIDWKEQSEGKIVVPGLGIYFMSPREKNWDLGDITREMHVARQYGMGHAYFRSRFFTDNLKGIYDIAAEDIDKNPALVPAMTWAETDKPQAPTLLSAQNGRLEWLTRQGLTYNIYSSKTWPVDISRSENLMLSRQEIGNLAIPDDDSRYYAVTAMDRFGYESSPTQSQNKEKTAESKLIPNDGTQARLPEWALRNDGIIMLAGITGNLLRKLQQKGDSVDIKSVPNGFYQLRSLNRTGISHRLGYLMIKRF